MAIKDLFAWTTPRHAAPSRDYGSEDEGHRAARRGGAAKISALVRELSDNDAWTRVPAAMGGVALIARICASMPVSLIRRSEDGEIEVVKPSSRDDGEFARLLRRPNRHQSPYEFFNTCFNQLKAFGNCYIYIKPGPPKELWVLNARSVDVRLTPAWHKQYRYRSYDPAREDWRSGIPGGSGEGQGFFDTSGTRIFGDSPGRAYVGGDGVLSLPLPGRGSGDVVLEEHEVVHVKDQSMHPLYGVNPAAQYKTAFGLESAIRLIASEYAAVGARKPILVAARDPNTPEDKLEDAREELENFSASIAATYVAGGDFSVQEFGTGLDNMDEQRMAALHDVWRIYGVPPTYGGREESAGSSKQAEEMSRVFLQTTIVPAQTALGHALRDALSPQWHTKSEPVEVYWDRSGFAKAALIAQTQHHTEMLLGGVINPNEVRQDLGLPPREGGDKYLDPEKTGGRMGAPNKDDTGMSDAERGRKKAGNSSREERHADLQVV